MPSRDFFAFCTSLQPLELKALGALSESRHVEEGITIYEAGEPGDTLYIINRGTLEIRQPGVTSTMAPSYLSRGEIFGDADALMGNARPYSVVTCEPVSLRCFRRDDFAEIVRKVPSFFLFLSEHLAERLLRAREAPSVPRTCLELSGSLSNFDLITIYQTIVNSSQTGELSICDEGGELVSAFFFESGQPRGAQFQHLTGEEAFWQLFLAADLHGTFSFTSGPPSISQSIRGGEIARSANDMLINALQARDEFHSLRAALPGTTIIERHTRKLDVGASAPADVRQVMEQIWALPFEDSTPVRTLYPQLAVSELKIYQAVTELLKAKQMTLLPAPLPAKVA